MVVERQPTVAETVVIAGALVTFLASFLPFVGIAAPDGDTTWTAWSTEPFLFPLSTAPAVLALAVGVWTGLACTKAVLPNRVLGFDARQLTAVGSFAAGLFVACWLVVDLGTADKRVGALAMVAGSAAMVTGSVLLLTGRGRAGLFERRPPSRRHLRVLRPDDGGSGPAA